MLRLKVTGFIVKDVPETTSFYERAFGLPLHYMHPSLGYAELNAGGAVLAFLSEEFVEKADLLGGQPIRTNRLGSDPIAAHVALWSDNIEIDWSRAAAEGARVVKPLEEKPWGQTAGYLMDQNGVVVELCTPSPRPMPIE
jgi:lactoylglutathione lyase